MKDGLEVVWIDEHILEVLASDKSDPAELVAMWIKAIPYE